MRIFTTLFACLILVLVSGCSTYAVDRYTVSVDAQEQLLGLADRNATQKVAVEPFTATAANETEIGCRAVGPIKTPDGESFAFYIRKALIDQLKLAQRYSADGPIRIRANVDNITFSSHEGMWSLAVIVSDAAGNIFAVNEDYDFKSSYFGETACNQTAQAFMPAVQNLVVKIVSHPVFKIMLSQPA
jgi:hypothetical protein